MHISSTTIPLLRDNIDTDQIIPAKFLSITDTKGLGKHLFSAWRYNEDGSDNPDFVLNQSTYTGSILITGQNFGCGSSREHAAWALKDYGFQGIIAPSFSDIFYNNALNNSLLVVRMNIPERESLHSDISKDPETQVTIDLESQTVTWNTESYTFDINPFKKYCLMTGKGNLEYILSHQEKINEYERNNV